MFAKPLRSKEQEPHSTVATSRYQIKSELSSISRPLPCLKGKDPCLINGTLDTTWIWPQMES
jgi:hypothetical protein